MKTCDVGGSTETRLTDGKGHADGADYTPDGKWIWLNSSRSGSAQLWRLHPDGSGFQQMTDDSRVNWFPTPRPTASMCSISPTRPGLTATRTKRT